MIGEKKLSTIKTEIRDAFARKGIDVETWLDEQMAKLRRQPGAKRTALESLRLMRDGLKRNGSSKRNKKRSRKAGTPG